MIGYFAITNYDGDMHCRFFETREALIMWWNESESRRRPARTAADLVLEYEDSADVIVIRGELVTELLS
jgi:hypothetical protein